MSLLLDGISSYTSKLLGFGGTDNFTQGLSIGSPFFFNNVHQKEIYETITNNEFNLYKTTSELFIVVNKKATMFSNGIYRIKNYKTNEVVENHPLLKLLENPNPIFNRNLFLMDICVNYSLYGNSYIFKNQGSYLSEYPSILFGLPNWDLKMVKTGKIFRATSIDEMIEKYELTQNKETFAPNEIIHLKTVNQEEPLKGLSPLHAIQMELSNIRGAKGFRNVNITQKGALGIISPDGKDTIGAMSLDDEKRIALEKEFTKTHGIFDNQSRFKFSNTPIKYDHLSHPIKDSMLFEEVSVNMEKIIDNYGLNLNIFSQKQGSTYENLQAGLKMAYQDSIIPFSELYCYALNSSLNTFDKGIYIELDYSHLPCFKENEYQKAQTSKLRVEALNLLMRNGYTKNEAELLVNLKQS